MIMKHEGYHEKCNGSPESQKSCVLAVVIDFNFKRTKNCGGSAEAAILQ